MSIYLTAAEIRDASKRTRADAQARWALRLGWISDPRQVDADGRPLILRSVFFGHQAHAQPARATPEWGALRG